VKKSIFVDVEYMEDESCKDCIAFTSFKLGESVILVNDFLEMKSKEEGSISSQILKLTSAYDSLVELMDRKLIDYSTEKK
jgi:hypothetical protein